MNTANQNDRIARYLCESNLVEFARYVFKNRDGRKLIVCPLHRLICNTLERVYNKEIVRLIINIPPGYTKTELVVKAFISWGLAKEPRCKFMHLSYSDALAAENSASIKEVIESDYYKRLWPQSLKYDSQAKRRWYNQSGGGVYAAATGAAVTGFRAGRDLVSSAFSGALIIDDPLKPEDSYSRLKREAINNRFMNTVRSRLVNESVPIVIIMQRLHVDDLSGVLLRGASGDLWDHINIAANYNPETSYPAEYTHGRPVAVDLPAGPIWSAKHTLEQLQQLEKADRYTYSAQYNQDPIIPGGSLFTIERFGYYDSYNAKAGEINLASGLVVKIKSIAMFADTAHKTGQQNDYTVLAVWGKGADGRIYLIDLVRGKFEAPALKRAFIALCQRWAFVEQQNLVGLRAAYIEDKASGIGLIQEMSNEGKVRIVPVQRNVDKVSRAYSAAPAIEEGKVILPKAAPWLSEFVKEHADFSPTMAHRFDDQVDTTMDSIQVLLHNEKAIDYRSVI